MGKISSIFNFKNIGKKIKNLTKWSCWITILLIWIAAPIAFIALVANDADLCWIPLVGAIVAPFFIWIGCWTLYAFGELVDKTCDSANNTFDIAKKTEAQANDVPAKATMQTSPKKPGTNANPQETRKNLDPERMNKLMNLRVQGLITEEEYQQAISRNQ